MKATKIEVLKAYLQYHLVSTYASYLSTTIDDEDFTFYGKLLQGAEAKRARWKRVLDAEESAMGMVLGKLWTEKGHHCRRERLFSAGGWHEFVLREHDECITLGFQRYDIEVR